LEEVQERKVKKKGAYYNYGIRGYLQKECHMKNKTKITNSNVGTKNKTKLLMIVFSIIIVCKHTWFINY